MATIKHDDSDEVLPVRKYFLVIKKRQEIFFLIKIDDHQIMAMSVKELNTLLKNMKPDDANNIKRRRRILKNKGYAANSRHRQTSLTGNLSVQRNQLRKQVNEEKKHNLFICLYK